MTAQSSANALHAEAMVLVLCTSRTSLALCTSEYRAGGTPQALWLGFQIKLNLQITKSHHPTKKTSKDKTRTDALSSDKIGVSNNILYKI